MLIVIVKMGILELFEHGSSKMYMNSRVVLNFCTALYLQNCVIVSEINFIIVLFYCKNFIEVLMDFFGRSLSSGSI